MWCLCARACVHARERVIGAPMGWACRRTVASGPCKHKPSPLLHTTRCPSQRYVDAYRAAARDMHAARSSSCADRDVWTDFATAGAPGHEGGPGAADRFLRLTESVLSPRGFGSGAPGVHHLYTQSSALSVTTAPPGAYGVEAVFPQMDFIGRSETLLEDWLRLLDLLRVPQVGTRPLRDR